MKIHLLHLLFPFLLIFSSAAYDHIQLVQTWPVTFCASGANCVPVLPRNFTLHDLWPANSKGVTIRHCHSNTSRLNSTFSRLKADLVTAWPSIVLNMKNEDFWQHEWLSHGSCTTPKLTTDEYFESAIREKDKINLLNVLHASNITPNNSTQVVYTRSNIETTVKRFSENNFNIYVSCKIDNNSTTTLLYEIYICLDDTARHYISCPPSQKRRGCGGLPTQSNITVPTF